MPQKLSPHQARLWFIDQFERGHVYPHPPNYHNLPLVITGTGKLSLAEAKAALETSIERHAALRIRLTDDPTKPRQSITEDLAVPWRETILPSELDDSAIQQHLIDSNSVSFTLHENPLLRAELVRLEEETGDGRFWWLITLHHLIADSRSLDLLAGELATSLRQDALSPIELQYPDYVNWQLGLSEEALEPLLMYWKWQLRGRISPVEIPTARPRTPLHQYAAGRHKFAWDGSIKDALSALADAHSCSRSVALIAAFKVLLHRYAQQDEITIGTGMENRRQVETERTVGPISNLVVLRSDLSGNPTFSEFLKTFAETYDDAAEHQEFPFDSLVQALNPAKDMSRTALFDILVRIDESPRQLLEAGQLGSLCQVDLNLGHGKYDLNLHAAFTADNNLAGTLTYNAELFESEFVTQFVDHLQTLVLALSASPETKISEIALLSPAERDRQIHAFNDTKSAAPRNQTLVSLFATQAAQNPHRIALQHGSTELTYAELHCRSNQLAHLLIGQGVRTDTLVAVALPRGIELIISLLAVLKAGGAYLPVEPTHPADRLKFTFEDASIQHLITDAAFRESMTLPETVTQVICTDRDEAEIAAHSTSAPDRTPSPEDLAYCIYTSGSTGRPKGVLIEHRQVVRLMINDRSAFDFNEHDVWSLFHSVCFDFSVWEMYGALLFGGRLVVVTAETSRDPAQFADLLISTGVTILNQTPSAFKTLDTEFAHRGYPAHQIRQVVFGGEALAPLQLAGFARAYPETHLINMFGITETTVHVTYHRITSTDIKENRPVIGRPIPTTSTLLLDEQQQLVPIGVPAEIYVGGEGLARGYLNRLDLTREKFIPNPYAPAEKLYRSGDLGMLYADGTMAHLGRIDDQVQIRGFRIELGEIQTQLLQHDAVTHAEIVAQTDSSETMALTAYFVATQDLDTSELRLFVSTALPDYMVPTAFVRLAELPLTANGKIDRAALPDPSDSAITSGPEFSAPETTTESTVASIFSDLLNIKEVGRNHNFFELGGHSLMAAQFVSRVREELKVELPLKHVFTSPTVVAISTVIDEAIATPANQESAMAIPRAQRRAAPSPATTRQP